MSFSFGNNSINQFKAQSAYKDASGMGGGGMYFKQKKKDKDDDIFQSSDEEVNSDSIFDEEMPKDVPMDNLVNKFVNWFRKDKS